MKKLVLLSAIFVFSFTAFGQSNKRNCAPKFNAVSLENRTFNLNELKGKVVVVTFWSTRCSPCVAGISKYNQLAREFKDQNVVFLAVTGENTETVRKFLRKKPFDFNIVSNGLGVMMKFAGKENGVVMLPTPSHYLINQDGEIELTLIGFNKKEKLESEIKRLLSKNGAD